MNFLKNSLWSIFGNIGVQLIGLLTMVVLARLLNPEIIGGANAAIIFIVLIITIQEAGFSSFIIYKDQVTSSIRNTVFFANIFISVLFCLLIAVFAENIANIFGNDNIEHILYFSTIGLILGSLGISSRANLMKKNKFNTIAKINILAELVGVGITFVLFFLEAYYFAVASRVIFRPAIQSLFLLYVERIKITGFFKWSSFQEIVRYSVNVLGAKFANFSRNNVDYFLIGSILGDRNLGIYSIAFQWSTVARFYLSGSIGKVLLPRVSKQKENNSRNSKELFNVIVTLMYFIIPFCLSLVFFAEEFILIIYGEQWKEAIPILQVLMIVGITSSLSTLIGFVFQGIGFPEKDFKFNLWSLIFLILVLVIGTQYNLITTAILILVHSLILDNFFLYSIAKTLKMKLFDLYLSLLNPLIMFLLSYIIMRFGVSSFINIKSEILGFIVQCLGGLIIYILIVFSFEIKTILNIIKRFKVRK